MAIPMRYPIHFVVKHHGLEACAKRSRPEAVETCSLARACFWIEAPAFMQKASIEKQERVLVELTGIELEPSRGRLSPQAKSRIRIRG